MKISKEKLALLIGVGVLLVALIFIFAPIIKKDRSLQIAQKGELMSTVEELIIEDLQEGTGEAVVSGDNITIHYTGMLTNGAVFDSSVERGEPFKTQIGVGQLIAGWDEGIPGMKVGGKRKLTIPAHKAYGNRNIGKIPANSTLIFDVELISIDK